VKILKGWLVLVVLVLVVYAGCQYWPVSVPENHTEVADFEITFWDVGQADSALIQCGGQNWLVDAGTNTEADHLVMDLRSKGIQRLDAVVGTHPHEDHIGGLDEVIRSFAVGQVFLPGVSSTTQSFNDLLEAVQIRGLTAEAPIPGNSFTLGTAQGMWLAPDSQNYNDLNNYSLVMRLAYGNWSFLLTGDAGAPSEQEMLAAGRPLQSTVLKAGHHGSSDSTSTAFLQAVQPRYAVISVGLNNDYHHPHAETLDKFKNAGVEVLRTDYNGNITFIIQGAEMTYRTQK
jgi:competence protein ComEC